VPRANLKSLRRLIEAVAGALIVLTPLSLTSGGFVIYLNHVAVALASKPVMVLLLEVLVIAVTGGPVVLLVLRARRGLLLGFFLALFLALALYALANIAALVLYLIVAVSSAIANIWVKESRTSTRFSKTSLIFLAIFLAIYIPLALYAPVASSSRIDFVELDRPPEVNALKRFIPLMTAHAYAADRLQIPTHTIYSKDSYVYFANGRSVYNWVIEPQGLWNELTKPSKGFIFVYGDVYPPQVEVVQRDVAWGLHNTRFCWLFFDNLYRQIVLRVGLQYEPLMEDSIKLAYDGELLILIPVKAWDRGLLHSVPLLHGYAVVHEDGMIEFVGAKDALKDPRFKDVPVVPEAIARAWVEIRRYHVGFVDFYLYRNTYVIRDVGTNPQPYLSLNKDGRTAWVFVAEPPGEAYSAKYIMYVDPRELRPVVYAYTLPTPMIGISRVESYVKQYNPMFDWSQLAVEEPTPLLVNDTLYWKVAVVTNDFRGLVLVALVNAKTGTVTSIDVTKWDFRSRGNVTADHLLQLVAGPSSAIETGKTTLEDRIKRLEQLIQRMRGELEELEKELEELKRQLAKG